MPDMWMDVDAAVVVPVNLLPLADDTDFKSEENPAYNAGGMDLFWNFVTTAGVVSCTPITPTTASTHDWACAEGMATMEIPATHATAIKNDTEGFGWFSGRCTGVLPWRGPVVGFRAAALNNALVDGGDTLDVNVVEIGGATQSLADFKDFADAGYDPTTHKVEAVKVTDNLPADPTFSGTVQFGGTVNVDVPQAGINEIVGAVEGVTVEVSQPAQDTAPIVQAVEDVTVDVTVQQAAQDLTPVVQAIAAIPAPTFTGTVSPPEVGAVTVAGYTEGQSPAEQVALPEGGFGGLATEQGLADLATTLAEAHGAGSWGSATPVGWVTLTHATVDTNGDPLGPVEVDGVASAGVLVEAYTEPAKTNLVNAVDTGTAGILALPVPPHDTYTLVFSVSGKGQQTRTVIVP